MGFNFKLAISKSLLFLLLFTNLCFITVAAESHCKAWLVQSIPTDMPHLRRIPGVLSTGNSLFFLGFYSVWFPTKEKKKRISCLLLIGDVLRWLAGNSTKHLDVIAQYWQLVAHPDDSRSGDYGYSIDDMKKFGAFEGSAVYRAIEDAADRNVSIRCVFLDVCVFISRKCHRLYREKLLYYGFQVTTALGCLS